MTDLPLRVIKLGGSLLAWAEWREQLLCWLDRQAAAVNILIVGGGVLVEAVRELDRRQQLSAEASHWLAIEAMRTTAENVARQLHLSPPATSLTELSRSTGGLQILDVEPLLRAEQGQPQALPCGWDVTSDSIAAHVARTLSAAELVLLKSTLPETLGTRKLLAEQGYVDDYFPIASRGLRTRCVDLRSADFSEIVLSS